MPLLSHPFRLLPNGMMAVQEDATDAYMAERIALLLTTTTGERPLVPDFGVGDLAFNGLSKPALEVQANLFSLPVDIINVVENVRPDESIEYLVEFNTRTGGN